jgi:hypothetical protein
MKRARRRKCRCCHELFRPDPRNLRHQRYCCKASCRRASHAASQQRWLTKAENRDYFRGADNVARVQAWRRDHPGYWRARRARLSAALQDDCHAQVVDTASNSIHLALQEIISAQPLILMGLIAHVSGSALQDDIASTSHRLLQLGQDIVGGKATRAASGA